jgi:pantoate ligase/cytidylate kinase
VGTGSSDPSLHAPEIGLVPTMGALHVGHLSLIQRARQENDIVVVSIFVNPLQFGPHEDFQQYPRTLEQDRALCEQAGVDAIFAPSAEQLGIKPQAVNSPTQVMPPAAMMSVMCGPYRAGHFQGVATIVTKLLNLVQPDRAYFGQKDAQQLAIIRCLVSDLNLPIEIIGCPTVRERSGLAYSSRNQYLTPEQREQAAVLYRSLQQAKELFNSGECTSSALIEAVKTAIDTVPVMQPEYIELVEPTTLVPLERIGDNGLLAIAARLGSTRLIDNICLSNRKPIVAIDGPAGAGKSTIARQLAQTLRLMYLDTGAMYRALTWLVLQSGIAITDEPAVAELVSQCEIQLEVDEQLVNPASGSAASAAASLKVRINGQNVTQEIRSLEVTSQVSAIAAQAAVRTELVKQQQRYGRNGGIVIEGRDIGTHVFPDAELKIFLTASVQERARRRQQDLRNQGRGEMDLEALERTIIERDYKDSNRAIAPLRKATDAIEVQTDNLSITDVINQIAALYTEVVPNGVIG